MFDKLDAYNLVANLVPGAVLVFSLNYSGFPAPAPENVAAFLIIAFVAGVAVNRLGSLILDTPLRKIGFLKQKNYISFVNSEKNDKKLETLVANAGLYRTFFTAGLVYLVLIASNHWRVKCGWSTEALVITFVILGMMLFLFAFRKEDNYIHDRLEDGNSASPED